jgi:HK97 family phage portal protein
MPRSKKVQTRDSQVSEYLENPQHSIVDALSMLLRDNASGVSVNHDSIMGIPAARRATQIVSGLIGRIPVAIVKLQDGLNKIDLNHPNQQILRRPNQHYGIFTLVQTLTANACWFGNGYGLVIRDDFGNVEAIGILDSEKTYPLLVNGQLQYKTEINNDKVIVPPEQILHVKNLGSTGLVGWSVIDQLKDSLGLSLALIKFSTVYFRNNASLGTIIEYPSWIKDKEEIKALREGFAEIHQGVNKSHRLAILMGGAKVSQLSTNAEQAQLLQSKQHDIITISNITGVPPHMLGSPRNTGYNSLEMENQSWLDNTISIWLATWAEAWEQILLTEYQKRVGSHSVQHDLSAFIKADTKTTHDIMISDLNNGVRTFNEVRIAQGQEPTDEDFGDYHRIPANTQYSELVSAQAALDSLPPETTDVDPTESLTPETGTAPTEQSSPDDVPDPTDIPDARYKTLVDATMNRLNKRLEKSLGSAIETRDDIDIDGHIAVFVESSLFNEDEARAYITEWIRCGGKGGKPGPCPSTEDVKKK